MNICIVSARVLWKCNFMKGGIIASDQITAVSPTYKEEIQYEFFGEKLDGLLRKHNDKLSGIVNGLIRAYIIQKRIRILRLSMMQSH